MSKSTIISSMVGEKCPRCRKGDMFTHPLYKVNKFWEMQERCSHCDFRFEVEPGFFFGAMYFTYALNVAVLVIVGLILNWGFDDPELWVYMSIIPTIILLLLPFAFRYSRILFLYLFGGVSYEK